MLEITSQFSILTLNANGLKSPIKRHWAKRHIVLTKEDPTICCLQETHPTDRNKYCLRVKVWKNIYQANGPQK
jgi:exonuclease III